MAREGRDEGREGGGVTRAGKLGNVLAPSTTFHLIPELPFGFLPDLNSAGEPIR